MADGNPQLSEVPSGSWTSADARAALAKAYDIADANAARATDWYTHAMRWRGRTAKAIRLLALVLFGIGGLIPIAKGFLGALSESVEWNDIGYVALAMGAGLLGFDHFFGISSAYTRFVTTEIALRSARHRFHTDWLALLSESGAPKPGALQPFVGRLKEFVTAVLYLVESETQEWVAEFRSSLSDLEKLGNRSARSSTRPTQPSSPDQPPSGTSPRNGGLVPDGVTATAMGLPARVEEPTR